VTTFQSLLDEAKKMQADGLRPHQIVARLGDRANDLGHPIVHPGGLKATKLFLTMLSLPFRTAKLSSLTAKLGHTGLCSRRKTPRSAPWRTWSPAAAL
jgi:hypothetical protein